MWLKFLLNMWFIVCIALLFAILYRDVAIWFGRHTAEKLKSKK